MDCFSKLRVAIIHSKTFHDKIKTDNISLIIQRNAADQNRTLCETECQILLSIFN